MSKSKNQASDTSIELSAGRTAYDTGAWADAHRLLGLVDQVASLGAEDLEKLATSAYLIGRDSAHQATLERAHHIYANEERHIDAARCAFWLGLSLLFVGKTGSATGWLARSHRLLSGEKNECVEQGYLLIPTAEQQLATSDCVSAHATAAQAVDFGVRYGDAGLISCARHQQGRALIGQGHVEQGLTLLDEAMISVTAGELSPIMTGLIYCSVIEACHQVYALARASEWTTALAKWCKSQPQMVSFSSTCLVHRSEIMQFHGEWPEAIREAKLACTRNVSESELSPPATAYYQQAEIHRLHGDFSAADIAYRDASQQGLDPQPGLALLRLVEGRSDVAAATIRRAVESTPDPLPRAKLLPAYVEIMLAVGDIDQAQEACRDLIQIAEDFDTGVLGAMAAHAEGAVQLAKGDAHLALPTLRRAFAAWQQAAAPYQAARVRVLLGLACRKLGDEEGASMELTGARTVFERLLAAIDLAHIGALTTKTPSQITHRLTPRQLEVLRLVATGKTNKTIAAELYVSEKTVDRHVSNIFNKLDVSTRAAATAYAYENKLI